MIKLQEKQLFGAAHGDAVPEDLGVAHGDAVHESLGVAPRGAVAATLFAGTSA
jgi:hypothetical protein